MILSMDLVVITQNKDTNKIKIDIMVDNAEGRIIISPKILKKKEDWKKKRFC